MPTGSGKSLCFQVPALVLGGLTIVVSPLVALMQDQVAALRLAGIAADTINSSKDRDENVAAWRRAASGETRLLYLSPERLMTGPMLAALAKLPVQLIAVDEAHCISQWGPAFRPDYESLSRLREIFPRIPIMALTATADESTRADIAMRLFGGAVEQIVLGFDRPNISLTVTPKQNWKQQLLDFVQRACRPKRHRLLPVAQADGGSCRAACGRRHPGARLSRRHEQGSARRQPERVHDRTLYGDGRHHRLRHGHRQIRCAVCVPYRSAGERRKLLPGDRPGWPRRRAGRSAHAVRARGYPHAPDVHRPGRIERRTKAARASAACSARRLLRCACVPAANAAVLFRRGSRGVRQLRCLREPRRTDGRDAGSAPDPAHRRMYGRTLSARRISSMCCGARRPKKS